jgi:hypothetical protein
MHRKLDRMGWTAILGALALVWAASAGGAWAADPAATTRHDFSIGAELNAFAYEESGIDLEGPMYGVVGRYAFHHARGLMAGVEASYTYGETEYDGQTWGGTPVKEDSEDYIFEWRGLVGWDFRVDPNFSVTPYTGFGARYWNNDVEGRGSYERETAYAYSPLGVVMNVAVGGGWKLAFTFEYDLFWGGTNESHLSDVDPGFNDPEFEQEDGYGLRGAFAFGHERFSVEAFASYWDIEESDPEFITAYGRPVTLAVEPDNETKVFGVRAFLTF